MKTVTRKILVPATPARTVVETLFACEEPGCAFMTTLMSEAGNHSARAHSFKAKRVAHNYELYYFDSQENADAFCEACGVNSYTWYEPGWYCFSDDGDRYHLDHLHDIVGNLIDERVELDEKISDLAKLEGEKL